MVISPTSEHHRLKSSMSREPDYILKEEKLVTQLPLFFRTISGQKPSREHLEKLVQLIKSANLRSGSAAANRVADLGP